MAQDVGDRLRMSRTILDATGDEILLRVRDAAPIAADAGVVVRVGDEAQAWRNIGVDFPKGRRSAKESSALRRRVSIALEAIGVMLVETALVAKVQGDLKGTVRVGLCATVLAAGAAARLQPPPPSRR